MKMNNKLLDIFAVCKTHPPNVYHIPIFFAFVRDLIQETGHMRMAIIAILLIILWISKNKI